MSDLRYDHGSWRQGDVTLDIKELPALSSNDGDAEFFATKGVVVVTQTCDIVRSSEDKPFFQVAALVTATDSEIEQIRKYMRPRFVYVPQCVSMNLVGDLDHTISFKKELLAGWSRLPAPENAEASREFGYAAGRHRSRAAFPDRWASELDDLRNWLRSKSSKDSDEGRFAKAIEQMRIIANDVECPEEAHIICIIPHDTAPVVRSVWAQTMVPKMESKIADSWGCKVNFTLQTTSEITAAEYLGSLRLDFDALSRAA